MLISPRCTNPALWSSVLRHPVTWVLLRQAPFVIQAASRCPHLVAWLVARFEAVPIDGAGAAPRHACFLREAVSSPSRFVWATSCTLNALRLLLSAYALIGGDLVAL